MIKAVTVTNNLGESLRMELTNPSSSGLIIREIEGLGPVKATINFTESANIDGAYENSARLETRNIVLSLQFLPKPTIEDTRQMTYKYFPVKRNVRLHVETDNRSCYVDGRVESNEPDIFSKEEGCQISILCADPHFYALAEDMLSFYGATPMFEFPFENPDREEPLIEFGKIRLSTSGNVPYTGDSEIGVTIVIYAGGEATGLTIYDLETRQIFKINDEKLKTIMGGTGITKGDQITINSEKSKKSVTLLRSGVETNILNAVDRPIGWFELYKGNNVFTYRAEEGLEYLQFQIKHKNLYEGV